MDSEVLFKYKKIRWTPRRMASRFLDKLHYNKIENEQRSVILIYIRKIIFYTWEESAMPFCQGFFWFLHFIRILLSIPKTLFYFVYGGWCVVELWHIKKGQINLILYDIITDAPGSPGDCVHKTTRETFTPKSPGRPCVHSLHLISQGTSRDHLSPTK